MLAISSRRWACVEPSGFVSRIDQANSTDSGQNPARNEDKQIKQCFFQVRYDMVRFTTLIIDHTRAKPDMLLILCTSWPCLVKSGGHQSKNPCDVLRRYWIVLTCVTVVMPLSYLFARHLLPCCSCSDCCQSLQRISRGSGPWRTSGKVLADWKNVSVL
jgi:hypothetical protein